MTREEAIKILNRDDDSMRKGYFCINDFLAIEVLKSEEPKPMVEIDLYSVIKQKYIEREVLDKIRAEIAEIPKKYPMTMDYENGLKEALAIIDKYKTEREVEHE